MPFIAPSRHRSGRVICLLAAAGLMALATGIAPPARAETQDDRELPIAYSMEGNYLAGRLAGQLSDYGASADYFAEALLQSPEDPYLLERTLSLYLAAGEMQDTRAYAERLQELDKNSPLAGLTLGIDDLRRGRWAVAVEELKNAKSGPLLTLAAEVLSAWAEAGAGKTDLALARLDKLQGEKWYEYFVAYHGGLIASVAGNEAEAARRQTKALAIDDSSIVAIDAAVRSLARSGDVAKAREILDKALLSVPNHPALQQVADDLDAKRKPGPHVRKVGQGAAEILSGLGAAIIREDANDMGMIFLQLALSLDPGADLTRVTLAEALENAKRFEDAIAVLSKVPTKSPMKRNADIMIAFDYNSLDKVDDARATLERVIRKDPKDLEALNGLGNILRVRKLYAEASEVYTKAIGVVGDSPRKVDWQLFYNRGITYERTNQWPKAEADFRKALELYPDQPLALNYLGYSMIDRGMNLDEGMKMIQKAVDINPTDGFIVDSLGWAYYKLGRYEDAVRELERAIDLQAGDPTINDHLGDAYWKAGRRLEARFQWNHAKASKPEPEDLKKIEAKIKDGLPDEPAKAAADASPAPAPSTTP